MLLSVSEPKGYPALSLEINDGKVSSRCQTYEILLFTGHVNDNIVRRNEINFSEDYGIIF